MYFISLFVVSLAFSLSAHCNKLQLRQLSSAPNGRESTVVHFRLPQLPQRRSICTNSTQSQRLPFVKSAGEKGEMRAGDEKKWKKRKRSKLLN